METNDMKETTLWDLCAKFFEWIKKLIVMLWNVLLQSIKMCLRKWWLSVPLTLLIVGYALYSARPSNKWYKAETVAILNGPQTDLVKHVLEPYQAALHDKRNFPAANMSILGLSEHAAHNVMGLEMYYVIDCLGDTTADMIDYDGKYLASDTINCRMHNRLALRFIVHDKSVMPEFEQALLSYLNSNPLLVSTYEAYRADLQRHSDFCHEQVEVLDSLTYDFYFNQSPYTQIQAKRQDLNLLLGKREIVTLHNETLELFRYMQALDYSLSLCTAPVVFQNHFAIGAKAVNGMLRYGVVGLLIAFVLSTILCFCIENFRKFWQWVKND